MSVARTPEYRTRHRAPCPVIVDRGHLIAIEADGFGASTELVYQRSDLAEAASPENNLALEAALKVPGLPPLARELIRHALTIEIAEEAAVARAARHREVAHGHTRRIAGGVERALTGRGR